MRELSEIDVKILKELLKDGRKNFTAIAEACKTSKDIVWKHFKEMRKAGIIVGATIQFNYQKFGYTGVALILLSTDSQNINEVSERLKKIPNVSSFRYYNAMYSLAVISQLKSLRDLEFVKETMTRQSKINEIKTCLWTDVRNIPENILEIQSEQSLSTAKADEKFSEPQKKIQIDEIDLQIAEKLRANGRLPFSRIAQEIGTSTDTVTRRYQRLVSYNYIKVSIQVNFAELGYQAVLDFSMALTEQSETKEVVEKLSKIPGVTYLVKISGTYDLLVTALAKDCNDIIAISEEITKIPNIKKIEASIRKVYPAWPTSRQYISTF